MPMATGQMLQSVGGFGGSLKAAALILCVVANVAISFVEMPEAWILEATACCLLFGFCWWCKSVGECRIKCTNKAAGSNTRFSSTAACNGNYSQLQGLVSR